jgi:ABC-2 type transport system ATP-binding protein
VSIWRIAASVKSKAFVSLPKNSLASIIPSVDVLIRAQGLTKQFDALTAVDSLTFNVNEGEVLAFLGPNGAGKTTTVRMLSSVLKPTQGRASVAGYDVVQDARQVRRIVGHLTEFPGLYLRMRAREYLEFFGELQGMPPLLRRARAEQLMEEFGLGEAANRRLGEFSKGMRQKIALIRAMLHSPRALFLDEPTSAMDPHSAKQVRDAIARLRGSGHTVFLCTHNLFEAELLADRIAIIRRGRLLAIGTANELKRQFLGAYVMEISLSRPIAAQWPDRVCDSEVESQSPSFLRYRTFHPEVTNPMMLERLHDLGAQVVALKPVEQTLEQVYLRLVESP